MASPVSPANPPPLQPTTPPSQGGRAALPAPAGVGAAPTNMESGNGLQPPPAEKGYVETFVHWVAGWVSWLFKKICCCFFKEETPALQPNLASTEHQQAPLEPNLASTEQQQAPPPPTLASPIQEEVNFMRAFEGLEELEKKRICMAVGREVHSRANRWQQARFALRSFEDIGMQEIERNPTVLGSHLTLNQQSNIQPTVTQG